jgi:hypothetical protein
MTTYTIKKDKYLKTDLIFAERILGIIEDSIQKNNEVNDTDKNNIITALYENFSWIHSYEGTDTILE